MANGGGLKPPCDIILTVPMRYFFAALFFMFWCILLIVSVMCVFIDNVYLYHIQVTD